jgi:enoyl-CoA hydratase/carnithine racemase
MLTDRIDGARAEAWGLVNRAVAADELDAAVDDWANRLAAKSDVALHMAKTQFRALARQSGLGDTTETDGDLLNAAGFTAALRAAAGQRPSSPGSSGSPDDSASSAT